VRFGYGTGKPTNEKYIRINNTDIEKVNQFKYLGSIITNNSNITSEINYRINMANKYCFINTELRCTVNHTSDLT